MNYWKVIVATAVIFGAGVFTGGLLVNFVRLSYVHPGGQHHPATIATSNTPPGILISSPRLPEVLSKPFLPKLDDLLHLSSDQHKTIEKIITDAQGQMRKVTQDTRMSIRAELTPDQRARFDDVMKRASKRPANSTNSVVGSPSGKPSKHTDSEPESTNTLVPEFSTNQPTTN